MSDNYRGIGAALYDCVGGPLDGRVYSLNPDIHDRVSYTPRSLEGTSQYELRRGDDGVRRLYYVEPVGILSNAKPTCPWVKGERQHLIRGDATSLSVRREAGTMTEPIKPALNEAEWEYVTRSDSFVSQGGIKLYLEENYQIRVDESPAKLAALALYGQPFGFSREDVVELRYGIAAIEAEGFGAKELRNLADRIEALLPPEK